MNGYRQRIMWILIAMMVSGTSLAGLYKWTDSAGQVHYTDKPPVNQKAETLNPHTATPTGTTEQKVILDKQTEEFNKRQEEQKKQEEQAQKKALEEKQREQNCIALRNNLQLYLGKRRVAKNENGELVEVPYEEQLQEIEKIQEEIEKACDKK